MARHQGDQSVMGTRVGVRTTRPTARKKTRMRLAIRHGRDYLDRRMKFLSTI